MTRTMTYRELKKEERRLIVAMSKVQNQDEEDQVFMSLTNVRDEITERLMNRVGDIKAYQLLDNREKRMNPTIKVNLKK